MHPDTPSGCASFLLSARYVFFDSYAERVGIMKVMSLQPGNRRQFSGMQQVPFEDSNGVTIRECRRRVPDRRIDRVRAERINEAMFADCLWLG